MRRIWIDIHLRILRLDLPRELGSGRDGRIRQEWYVLRPPSFFRLHRGRGMISDESSIGVGHVS